MARPDDWIDRSVMFATDIYGGDTTGVLEEVDDRGVVVRHEIVEIEADSEIEAEIEADLAAELQTEIEAGAEIQVQPGPPDTTRRQPLIGIRLAYPRLVQAFSQKLVNIRTELPKHSITTRRTGDGGPPQD